MASTNPLNGLEVSGSDPTSASFAITPSDAVDLATYTRAIYVGVTGNISVACASDTAPVTFTAVPAGTVLRLVARRVYATGTTAASLVGMY